MRKANLWRCAAIMVWALGLLHCQFALGAATRAVKPDKAIAAESCVTAECHASVKAAKVVHGPVSQNACASCHELTDAARHAFKLTREKADLCTYCHEFSVSKMPVLHKPVKEGQCLGCHDPHGGMNRALVRENSTVELCGRCHEDVRKHKAFLHGPVAQGACDSCHTPHGSQFPKLLDAVGSDMCLACHKEFEPALAGAKFQHKAMEKGCDKCHDAHGSASPMSLVKPAPDLCITCHKKMGRQIAAARYPHTATSRDRSCMNCHAPHATNFARLMVDVPANLCLRCHNKAVKTDDGITMAAVPDVADSKLHKHGEITDGQCSGCHDVHGGQYELLLARPYSRAFYQSFSLDNYALCFKCHDARLALEAQTAKATGFRNGEKNLHFVHANSGEKDKNCRACHLTHAGEDVRLVRPTMRYGKSDMPMRFVKTDTGGSCQPGCHAQYAYDRVTPVASTRPTTDATSRPAAPTARVREQELRVISWSAKDIAGRAVGVPADGKASVMVLLAAEDADGLAMVNRLRDAVPNDTTANVVIVVSGTGASDRAASLASKAAWPIIADAQRGAVEELGVRGLPMVLVLRPDGQEVARLSGEAASIALKLPAYVDLALGRTDAATTQARLTTRPLIESGATTRSVRDLRACRALLDAGKPEQALAYLDRDPELNTTLDAQAMRIGALLQLKRASEAMKIIDHLPAAAAAQQQFSLLRAATLIDMGQRFSARRIIEDILSGDPKHLEAHRLMGRIYEIEQNWPKAAEHFRAATGTEPAPQP